MPAVHENHSYSGAMSDRTPAVAADHPLRARGLRLTQPRRLILEVVRASAAHPSAAVVHARLRRRLPRVSLATVYRNLRMLAARGLLRERADASGLRFDGNTAAHDHFTCVVCGRIFDVPSQARGTVAAARVASTTGFEVLDHRIEFYGRCAGCRRRGPMPTSTPIRERRSHGRAKPQGQ
jgi:Fe2+ or Zn2+ uptake regulation protein